MSDKTVPRQSTSSFRPREIWRQFADAFIKHRHSLEYLNMTSKSHYRIRKWSHLLIVPNKGNSDITTRAVAAWKYTPKRVTDIPNRYNAESRKR